MSKLYEVTFTLKVTELVEAEDKEDAEQQFSEMWVSAEDFLECGSYKIKRVKQTA